MLEDCPWDTLSAQEEQAARRAAQGRFTLLCCEPHPTYTAGRGAPDTERLWDELQCQTAGIAVRSARRGGRWTYHGPGQLVVYPIAPLDGLGLHSKATALYMNRFRQSVVRWLTSLGVDVELREDRPFGIYARHRKLAAFGVTLEGGVTRGGVAIYLTDQNRPFAGLIPCGVQGERMTSLQELGVRLPWATAASSLLPYLKEGLKAPLSRVTSGVQEEPYERSSRP